MIDPFFQPALPSHVRPHLVHDFNIYDFDGRDPFLECARLFEENVPPIFWTRNNGGHWVIRNAKLIRDMTQSPAVFSTSRNAVPDSMNADRPYFLPLQIDPPRHADYRNVVAPLLSPKRVAALENRLRDMTRSMVGGICARGECEFMGDFASQMPVVAFLQLLEFPLGDRARLLDITNRVVKPNEGEDRSGAMGELFNYLRPVIRLRLANPGDDIISRLVTSGFEGGALDFEDMLRLTGSLVLGGLDSTAATLGFFARHLADAADARRLLIDEPALIPAAVEEIFRRYAPGTLGRIAMEDTAFHGVDIRKGDHIQWAVAMYNLDPEQFSEPLRVDFKRKQGAHHGFGTGIHFCIGAFLARAEMKIFAEHWLRAIPDYAVKPGARIDYRTGINICYRSLPLVA